MVEEQQKKKEGYKKIKTLGQGSFGTANLVMDRQTRQHWVIKTMDMNNMDNDEKKLAVMEGRILQVLDHPNITAFKEVYQTSKKKLCIVMEFCDAGSLDKLIEGYKQQECEDKYIPEEKIWDYFTQLALALKHCHDRKVLHRDLKSGNVFMNQRGILKLGDFGIAKILSHTAERLSTQAGTPYYMAPELFQQEKYNNKADIWSLGIILFEMIALDVPFSGQNYTKLVKRVISAKLPAIPPQYSTELRDLLHACLEKKPQNRPSIHQILRHEIIEERINKYLSSEQLKAEFDHSVIHDYDFMEELKSKKQAETKAKAALVEQNLPDTQAELVPEQQKDKQEIPYMDDNKTGGNRDQMWQQWADKVDNDRKEKTEQELCDQLQMMNISQMNPGGSEAAYVQDPVEEQENHGQTTSSLQVQDFGQSMIPGSSNTGSSGASEVILDNLTWKDFGSFLNMMYEKFGEKITQEGLTIVKQDKHLLLNEEESNEAKIVELLAQEVTFNIDLAKEFLEYCMAWFIIESAKQTHS